MSKVEISIESLEKIETFIMEEESDNPAIIKISELFEQISNILNLEAISHDDLDDWRDLITLLAANSAYLSQYFWKIAQLSDAKLLEK